jgi:hypothetical protein
MLDNVRVIELSEDFDFSFDLFKNTLLLNLLLIEDLYGYFVLRDIVDSHYWGFIAIGKITFDFSEGAST